MHIYIYIYIHIYIYLSIHTHIYIHIHTYIHIYIYTYMYICTHILLHIHHRYVKNLRRIHASEYGLYPPQGHQGTCPSSSSRRLIFPSPQRVKHLPLRQNTYLPLVDLCMEHVPHARTWLYVFLLYSILVLCQGHSSGICSCHSTHVFVTVPSLRCGTPIHTS